MASATFLQSSFLGGEISQASQGRADLPTYRISMNVCTNSLPIEQGAWTRRPGTMFAAATRAGAPARTISYAFKQDNPYTMEFTNGHIRFYSGTRLTVTSDTTAVASISTANPAVVTLQSACPWVTGDHGMFNSLTGDQPLLLNRQFQITVTGPTTFTLADALTGENIDGSTLGTFVAGNFARIQDLASPYTAQAWANAVAVQSDKNVMMLQGTIAPQVIYPASEATPTGLDAQFAIEPANFFDGPYLDPPTNGTRLQPANITGLITLSVTFANWLATKVYAKGDYVLDSGATWISLQDQNVAHDPSGGAPYWQQVNAATAISPAGFVATDIGRHIRLFSEPPIWAVGTVYAAGNVVKYADAYYTCLSSHTAALTNAPATSLTTWGVNPNGARWTWGKVVSLLNVLPGTPPGSTNFGNMTGNGGVAAAFDGNISKSDTACAAITASSGPGTNFIVGVSGYVGQHFSTPEPISSVTIYPSATVGFADSVVTPLTAGNQVLNLALRLYGSNSPPSGPTDGTLLGEVDVPAVGGPYPVLSIGLNAVSIPSSQPNVEWSYVWVAVSAAVTASFQFPTSLNLNVYVSQLQFAITPSSGGGGTPNGVQVQLYGSDLLYTNAIVTWRFGVYSATTGWPTCGTYHEGRLWLAGSINNRFDASQPNQDFTDRIIFAPTEEDGTVTDASGISYVLNAPDVNSILWMIPDQQGIVVGTEKGEWLVQATTLNQPLTPTSIQAHRVTRIGCASALPLRAEHTILFVQRYKQRLMEYFADVFSGKFSSPNIAQYAQHLAGRGLEELAYQQNLSPAVWMRAGDGSLLGCSYKRESLMSSQGPTFAGWHDHTLGSGRVVESMCGGPSPDGTLDTICMVTSDGLYRYVEFLTPLFTETSAAKDAWFVDTGVMATAIQNATNHGVPSCKLTGLHHLEGKTVSVMVDGLDCGDYTVSGATVYVPYGAAGGLFTTAYASAATNFLVGFTYTSDGQIVRSIAPQESGARTGPALGKKRRVHQIAALLSNTQGISFGTSFAAGRMNAAQLATEGGTPLAANALYSGVHWMAIQDNDSYDGMICWRVTRPYPATICALEGFLNTKDA